MNIFFFLFFFFKVIKVLIFTLYSVDCVVERIFFDFKSARFMKAWESKETFLCSVYLFILLKMRWKAKFLLLVLRVGVADYKHAAMIYRYIYTHRVIINMQLVFGFIEKTKSTQQDKQMQLTFRFLFSAWFLYQFYFHLLTLKKVKNIVNKLKA